MPLEHLSFIRFDIYTTIVAICVVLSMVRVFALLLVATLGSQLQYLEKVLAL